MLAAVWEGAVPSGTWSWRGAPTEEDPAEAGPGWSLPLPFEHGLDLARAERLTASIELGARDERAAWYTCTLEAVAPLT